MNVIFPFLLTFLDGGCLKSNPSIDCKSSQFFSSEQSSQSSNLSQTKSESMQWPSSQQNFPKSAYYTAIQEVGDNSYENEKSFHAF